VPRSGTSSLHVTRNLPPDFEFWTFTLQVGYIMAPVQKLRLQGFNKKCDIICMFIYFMYKPLGIMYSLPFIDENSYLCKHVKTLCHREEKNVCARASWVVPQLTTSLRKIPDNSDCLLFGSSCTWTMKSVIGVSLESLHRLFVFLNDFFTRKNNKNVRALDILLK
jgi:hypothetical protein